MRNTIYKRLLSGTLAIATALTMCTNVVSANEVSALEPVETIEQLPEMETLETESIEAEELETEINFVTESAVKEESYVYAVMNVPYSKFYETVLGSSNTVGVDVVSSATANKSRNIPNTYYNATTPTLSNGTDIVGIKIPVKLTEEIYNTIQSLGLSENDNYYIGEKIEEPKVYLTLTSYADGNYSFGDVVGKVKTTDSVDATITTSTNYGDYQINLTDSSLGQQASNVYAMYVTASDGSNYAMRQLENVWTLSNFYQFAWSTGVKTKEPHGGVLASNHYKSVEGKTITGVTYITSKGIIKYSFTNPLTVNPHYTEGTVMAEVVDIFSVKVTGIPENAKDVTVDIYYASGRTKSYAAQNATVGEDGLVNLAPGLISGKAYTVAVNSSNYATITSSFTPEKEKLDGEYYMLTNIPYDEFYKLVGVDNDQTVDAVSSATTNKSRNIAKAYYESANTKLTGGTDILGVRVPVKMSYDSYASKFAVVSDNEAAHFVSGQVESPATYLSFDGSAFTLVTGETKTENDVVATISSQSNYGDYEIDIDRNHKSGYKYTGRNGQEADAIGLLASDVYGVYLTATDGSQYALRHLENLWTLSDIYEFAWSTGVKTTEPHGGILSADYYKSMEGKSIASVTYVTVRGLETYNFKNDLFVAPHYTSDVKAELSTTVIDDVNVSQLSFSKLPSDFVNGKVSVYRAVGRSKTYLVENADMAKEITCAVVAENGVDYTLSISSDNYATYTKTITLGSYIKAVAAQTYTGVQVKPALLVYNNGKLLTEKVDYTVTYKNNIKLTTENKKAEATVTFKGNYSGKLVTNFDIVECDISQKATVADIYVKESKKDIKISPVVYLGNKKLKDKTEYTLSSYTVSGTPGTTEITVTGAGCFKGSVVFKVHVIGTASDKINIAKVSFAKIPNQTYTGREVKLSDTNLVAKYNKKVIDSDCYTVKYLNNVELGTATIIIMGNEDEGYTGYVTKTFKIVATPITNYKITASADTITYGDSYTITVGEGRSVLREGTNYTVDRTALDKVGTGYVKITGIGLYTGTAKVKVKVSKAAITENMISVSETAIYDPAGAKPSVEVSFNDTKLTEGKDYTVLYSNNKVLSTESKQASVVVKAKGNFAAVSKGFTKSFTVVAKDLADATVITEDVVSTKSVSNAKATVVAANGKKLSTKAYTVVYTVDGKEIKATDKVAPGTKVTAYAKAVEGNGYCGQTQAVDFTVYSTSNKLSSAKITVKNQLYNGSEIVLDEDDFTAVIGSKKNETELKLGSDFTVVSYTNNTKAGTAKVVLRGINNYGGTKTVTFKITSRSAK